MANQPLVEVVVEYLWACCDSLRVSTISAFLTASPVTELTTRPWIELLSCFGGAWRFGGALCCADHHFRPPGTTKPSRMYAYKSRVSELLTALFGGASEPK